jgi:hypothetical protein
MSVIFLRWRRRLCRVVALLMVICSSFSQSAFAAPIIVNSSLGSGCVASYAAANIFTNRYVATSNVNLSAINMLIGNQSISSFSTTRIYIYSDNSSTNSPDVIISTFTPDALYGQLDTTTARFIGSQSIVAGSKFWIVPSVRSSLFPRCYSPSASISQMTFNGVIPDTSTSLSNSSFSRAYLNALNPPNPGTWSADNSGQMWQLSIEALPTPITASLSAQGGSNQAIYRTSTQLNVTVNASSKVTFFTSGKLIPGCRNIQSVAGIATCYWKPSVIGVNVITAKIVSLDSAFSDAVSSRFEVRVSRRTSLR